MEVPVSETGPVMSFSSASVAMAKASIVWSEYSSVRQH